LLNDGDDNTKFNKQRAEFFEALGHPTRIEILQILAEGPHSFTELKKQIGIESSGHLSFHLGKLGDLVKTNADGNYILTDDGKEAVRVTETSLQTAVTKGLKGNSISRKFVLAIVAIAIVWACVMVITSIVLSGTGFDTIVVILGGGFIACLLTLAAIGRIR